MPTRTGSTCATGSSARREQGRSEASVDQASGDPRLPVPGPSLHRNKGRKLYPCVPTKTERTYPRRAIDGRSGWAYGRGRANCAGLFTQATPLKAIARAGLVSRDPADDAPRPLPRRGTRLTVVPTCRPGWAPAPVKSRGLPVENRPAERNPRRSRVFARGAQGRVLPSVEGPVSSTRSHHDHSAIPAFAVLPATHW